MIPFIDLKSQYRALEPRIQARINAVLEHGQYIMGPEVRELEEKLTAYTGAQHCITVASGTEALLISLMALGVQPGDEVITTPFTFVATAEVIVLLGAKPIFVDIELDTCNMNVALIEEKITSRTRAIMPVSLYGQVADMDEINAIAERHELAVIEDAAQSFGADYKGRKSCNLSTLGCTSSLPEQAPWLLRRWRGDFHQRRRNSFSMPRDSRSWSEGALRPFAPRGRGTYGHHPMCCGSRKA